MEIIKFLKNLVSKNQIEHVLQQLKEETENKNDEIYNEVIQLEGRLKRLNSDKLNNLISDKDSGVEKSNIDNSAIKLIDKFSKIIIVKEEMPKDHLVVSKSGLWAKILVSTLLALGLSTFGAWWWFSNKSDISNPQISTIDSSTLGEIRYSILPLKQFQKLNGNGWIEIKGDNIEPTELYNFLTEENIEQILLPDKNNNNLPLLIPNLSGKFIRTMGEENRKVGTFQPYSTALPKEISFKGISTIGGEHSHVDRYYRVVGGGNGLEGANSHLEMTNGSTGGGAHEHSIEITEGGDKETRPTNVTFYTYIKVN